MSRIEVSLVKSMEVSIDIRVVGKLTSAQFIGPGLDGPTGERGEED